MMAYLNGLHVPKLLSAKTLMVKIVGTVFTVACETSRRSMRALMQCACAARNQISGVAA